MSIVKKRSRLRQSQAKQMLQHKDSSHIQNSITRNALCQAKARQSHQHTNRKRIQPDYETYRMRNTLRSAGQSFSQPMLHLISTTHNRRINPYANTPIIIFRCYSSWPRRAFDEEKSKIISPKSSFSINSLSMERIAKADNWLSLIVERT